MQNQYQTLVSELLIITKVHCQTKTELQMLFDEIGVSHDNQDIIQKYREEAKNGITPS